MSRHYRDSGRIDQTMLIVKLHSPIHLSNYRTINRESHVLLNLLNELWKRDKMRGLPSILSLFRNEFNKFNNTRAQMLDSILSYDIMITLKFHFWHKNVTIVSLCTQLVTFPDLVVYRFYCMTLLHSHTRRHVMGRIFMLFTYA